MHATSQVSSNISFRPSVSQARPPRGRGGVAGDLLSLDLLKKLVQPKERQKLAKTPSKWQNQWDTLVETQEDMNLKRLATRCTVSEIVRFAAHLPGLSEDDIAELRRAERIAIRDMHQLISKETVALAAKWPESFDKLKQFEQSQFAHSVILKAATSSSGKSSLSRSVGRASADGLPPLRLGRSATARAHLKQSGSALRPPSTPACLKTSVSVSARELRMQLHQSQQRLQGIESRVKRNFAWVSSNMPVSTNRAAKYCRQWAIEKIASIANHVHSSMLLAGMVKWKETTRAHQNMDAACTFMRVRSAHKVMNRLAHWAVQRQYQSMQCWIAYTAKLREIEQRKAGAVLVRVARGWQGRRAALLHRQTLASITFQCCIRRRQALQKIIRMRIERRNRQAAIRIQTKARQHIATRQVEQRRQQVHEAQAATGIQSLFRGRRARKRVAALDHERSRQRAALAFQRCWRGAQGRRIYAAALLVKRQAESAVDMQRVFRGAQSRKRTTPMLQQKRGATKLQSLYRGRRGRAEAHKVRSTKAATKVQARWRGHSLRHENSKREAGKSAIRIQQIVRGKQARQEVGRRKELEVRRAQAADSISLWSQRHYRGGVVRQRLERITQRKAQLEQRQQERQAAICIERVARGHLGRRRAALVRQHALDAKANTSVEALRAAAGVKIQSVFRGYSGREAARLQRNELRTRQQLAAKRAGAGFSGSEEEADAAARIQAACRGFLARQWFGAVMIDRRRKRNSAAMIIQRSMRGKLGRMAVGELKAQHKAATKLQAMSRGRKDRGRIQQLRSENAAASSIQRIHRGRLARREIEQQQQRATAIHAVFRGKKARAAAAETRAQKSKSAAQARLEAAKRRGEVSKQEAMDRRAKARMLEEWDSQDGFKSAAGYGLGPNATPEEIRQAVIAQQARERDMLSQQFGEVELLPPPPTSATLDTDVVDPNLKKRLAVQAQGRADRARERAEAEAAARAEQTAAEYEEKQKALAAEQQARMAELDEERKRLAAEASALSVQASMVTNVAHAAVDVNKREIAAKQADTEQKLADLNSRAVKGTVDNVLQQAKSADMKLVEAHLANLEQLKADGAHPGYIKHIQEEHEQELSARRMQRTWRGFAARRRVQQIKADKLAAQAEAEAIKDQLEADMNATRIQSIFRGRRARRLARERRRRLKRIEERMAAEAAIQRMEATKVADEAARAKETGGAAAEVQTDEWQEYWDENTNQWYYFNLNTNEARWVKPGEETGYAVGEGEQMEEYDGSNEEQRMLDWNYQSTATVGGEEGDDNAAFWEAYNYADSNGWVEYWDDTHQCPYYYNIYTEETTWTLPEAAGDANAEWYGGGGGEGDWYGQGYDPGGYGQYGGGQDAYGAAYGGEWGSQ